MDSTTFEFKALCKTEYASIIKWSVRYKSVSRAHLNLNVVLPVPYSRSINSNFEADVLEIQVKWGKMHMIFVIGISKLTKTARSGKEVRKPCSCSLLVRGVSSFVMA